MKLLKLVIILYFLFIFSGINIFCQQDSNKTIQPEEIFLDFNYKNISSTVLTSYYYKDKIYLPVETLLKFLKININSYEDGNIYTGFFIFPDNEYEINLLNNYIHYNSKYFSLQKDDYLKSDKVLAVDSRFLRYVFGLNFNVDMFGLKLFLESEETLPLDSKYEREKLFEIIKEESITPPSPLIYKPQKSLLTFGFLDYTLSADYGSGYKPNYNFNTSLGSQFLGGELNLNFHGNFSGNDYADNNKIKYDGIWRYVFNKNKFIRQITAGRFNTEGLNQFSIDGVQISNEPVGPRISFATYKLRDVTIPDADVELYINNQLYDFVRADGLGNYSFNIPFTYGSNVVSLKIFGPNGEIIEDNKIINISTVLLPPGEFNYNISAGEKSNTKEKSVQTGLIYGLTDWLTENIGAEYVKEPLYNKPIFYNSLSARISGNYFLNYTYAHNLFHRFSFNAYYYSALSYGLQYSRYRDNSYYNQQEKIDELNFNLQVPVNTGFLNLSTQLGGNYYNTRNQKNYILNIYQYFNIAWLRPFLGLDYTKTQHGEFNEENTLFSLGMLASIPYIYKLLPFLNGNLLTGKIDYDKGLKRFTNLNLSFSTKTFDFLRLQLNYNKNFLFGSDDANLMFIFDFPFTRNTMTFAKNSYSSYIEGSIGMDISRKKAVLNNRQQTGSGAVSFRMFIDKNGNGIYDRGEETVKDGQVRLKEGKVQDNDEDEIIRVTELTPYMDYTTEIVTDAVKNPLIIPKYKYFNFTADPNVFKQIDIPFYPSAEVYGNILLISDNKEFQIQGLHLQLRNIYTGEIIETQSFSDGSFYYIGLPPGKYEAYIKIDDRLRYKSVSSPDKIEFEISTDGRIIPAIELNFVLTK